MSAKQSYLSSANFGYGAVVATTQASINAMIKEYLYSSTQPEALICYVADAEGNPAAIDYQTLLTQTNGTDPFSIPANADPATDPGIANLQKARFMVGFKATLGIPPGYALNAIPDFVTLGADATAVTFRLMCSEFIVVSYTPSGGYSPAQWMWQSQPPGAAWMFTSKVNMRQMAVAPGAALPAAVAAKAAATGGAFSIQKLLFDLDNAALETIPAISNVDPSSNLYLVLEKDFIGKYFASVKEKGGDLLGYVLTPSTAPPSTLTVTNLNYQVSPLLASNGQVLQNPTAQEMGAATLNYLCAVNGAKLPAPANFGWNWMETPDLANSHGVIAINRDTFASYFRTKLDQYVPSRCFKPSTTVNLDSASAPVYHWGVTGGQAPTAVLAPPAGATILEYSYNGSSYDQAGLDGDIGQSTFSTAFTLTVTFAGSVITITQHAIIYVKIRHLASTVDGNVVDKTITDSYTMTVDASGRLAAVLASKTADNSVDPKTNWFIDAFTGLNDLSSSVGDWSRGFESTALKDIPVSVVQDFVFPGGKTFLFKDAMFSAYQDLVAHITYASTN